MLVTRECVGSDYRVCRWWLHSDYIPVFKCAQSAFFFVSKMIQRCINYWINYGKYWKEFDSHFSVRRSYKGCHLIADMAFFSIKSLALKWYYFFLNGIKVFVEYFNLYMKQLAFNPGQNPGGGATVAYSSYVTIYAVTMLSVLFHFGFGIRNQRETRWKRSWTICCFRIGSLLLGR